MERTSWRGTGDSCQQPANNGGPGAITIQQPNQQGISQPQSTLKSTTAPVNTLTVTSWESPNWRHPAKLSPDSWPLETVWENKCSLFHADELWGSLLHNKRELMQLSSPLTHTQDLPHWLGAGEVARAVTENCSDIPRWNSERTYHRNIAPCIFINAHTCM